MAPSATDGAAPDPARSDRRGRRDLRQPHRDLGFAAALWRAVDVFRAVAVVYAVAAYATREEPYRHPVLGWAVLALMAVWTAVVWRSPRRPVWLLVTDLVLACGAVLMTLAVDTAQTAAATNTLPLVWPAAAVLSWAVWRGPVTGVIAALAVGAADLVVIDPVDRSTLHNIVLLLLAGAVVGFATELYERSRRELAEALEEAAAARERERLARDIHDSVLQVLAYVQRRAGELGGEAGELGAMAGEQEVRLRSLVSRPAPSRRDVRRGSPGRRRRRPGRRAARPAGAGGHRVGSGRAGAAARRRRSPTWSRPCGPACTTSPRTPGRALARSCWSRTRATRCVVTVRDDGVGVEPGRLEQAEADGRMGVSLSVRARVAEHGGSTSVWSRPGEGTEVEMRVPRS